MSAGKRRLLQLPWRSRDRIAKDVDAELSFHLEMRVSELIALGLDDDEARLHAQREFGDIEFTRAYCRTIDGDANRAARAADHLSEWRQDARYALRTLRRSPGFTALSLLTLALAIGANTAIFSVARAVLLEPLPYGNPNALFRVFESWPGMPGEHTPLAPANFADYRARQTGFADMAAYMELGTVTWQPTVGDPSSLSAIAVTGNLFQLLQVNALHGRVFVPEDDANGSTTRVVVSYNFWQHALGGNAALIGRSITLNGHSYDLLGVAPRGFTIAGHEDLWLPLGLSQLLTDPVRARRQHYLHALARLKPGTNIEAAQANLAVIAHRLETDYPDANTGRGANTLPLRDVLVSDLRPALLLLQAAAAMVLLIACANLANLTLSRTMGRRREMALRAALGAGRGRLVRQLISESVLLALVGGAVGVALAAAATRTLLALNPDALPAMFRAVVDARVLAFSLALSAGTGILFGLVPALDAARVNLNDSLKDGGRGSSGGRAGERVRRGLVVAQIGLAVMLLIGAGLLVRSFREIASVQLGFDPSHVLTAGLRVSGEQYDSSAAVNHFYDAVLADIARAPSVVAVGAADMVPMHGNVSTSLRIVGEPTDENHLPDIRYVDIRGEYFKALRIPLEAGRVYDESDTPDGPKTAIVNEAALRLFPNGQALGRRIKIGPDPKGEGMLVVGVVGDVRDERIDLPAKPALYANHRQEAWERSMSVIIRTSGDPQIVAPMIRSAVRAANPALAVRDVKTMNAVVGSSLAQRRFALALITAFAFVALVLAAIGIYGVLAYAVTTRTREFGVRIALGASTRSVLGLVVKQGLQWSLVGLVLGLVGAIAGGRLLARMLYGIGPLDLVTYLAVVTGLSVVVLVACVVPALRATRVDPLTSMRAE